jgi:hypothetical protein
MEMEKEKEKEKELSDAEGEEAIVLVAEPPNPISLRDLALAPEPLQLPRGENITFIGCRVCQMAFFTEQCLYAHRAHTGHGCFRCPICRAGYFTPYKIELDQHIATVHHALSASYRPTSEHDRLRNATETSSGQPRRFWTGYQGPIEDDEPVWEDD